MQADMLELSKYRMLKAKECLADAQDAFEESRLANSINRSYYAMFHATRALLAIDSFDSKKHSSILGYFNQQYIASKRVETNYYQMLANAFRVRNKTDYDDFYIVSREETLQQLNNAQTFITFMNAFIDSLIEISE
ncbi:MAG TPA: HEPN domain-containing protein [Methylomusa anaerophila]|uniref:HEPN domain protein n=1 Tax=Methylomusa anaerophila TaxID=1930071 RepID=A0A348AKB9_9FIRM|nr:HEPN domain-containing protein [Methylomusa anaerophila]BBB91517.1 HEPN domain protein [Methylomusa anaerophila]HML89893.1 HEPN domain-containing protein [Methylomusa anaerophila]HML89896.1 HEPN domain-containing protein [Methylomusa anaerophila]